MNERLRAVLRDAGENLGCIIPSAVLVGALALGGAKIVEKVGTDRSESAIAGELRGPGYSVGRSMLGPSLLRVEGFNSWAIKNPDGGAEEGIKRVGKECGTIQGIEKVSTGVVTVVYVRVPDREKCFPKP